MNKLFSISLIIIFICILILPMVFVNISGGEISKQENRMLASRPSLELAFEWPSEFIRNFNDWFNDNIGFREKIISFYQKLNIISSRDQYKDGQYIMLIGQNGHHYFADVDGNLIPKFQGKDFLTNEQLVDFTNGLNKIKLFLDNKEIPLIVMFCADKESIYPEFYPRSIVRGPEPIQLDIITNYILEHTDIDIFNIKECLINEKNNYPVFDKDGDAIFILTHYNEIGAFFAYRELIKHVNYYMPDIKAFTIDDIEIKYAEKLASNGKIYKDIPDVNLIKNINYFKDDSDIFTVVNIDQPSQGIVFKNSDIFLPKILIMHDSYTGTGNFISRYIPQQFSETVLIHWANMRYLTEYIEKFNPDIIVFESAERMLGSFSLIIIDAIKNGSFN